MALNVDQPEDSSQYSSDQHFPEDADLSKFPEDKDSLGALIDEIRGLESTIRDLQRQSTQILGMGFAMAGIALAVTSATARDVAVAILPLFFGLIVTYHLNSSAEVAALAELRDRLSIRANAALGTRVFALRLVSDFRRASLGTWASFLIAGIILIASVIAGIETAFAHASTVWRVMQIALSVLVVAGCLAAATDIPRARIDVNLGLGKR